MDTENEGSQSSVWDTHIHVFKWDGRIDVAVRYLRVKLKEKKTQNALTIPCLVSTFPTILKHHWLYISI